MSEKVDIDETTPLINTTQNPPSTKDDDSGSTSSKDKDDFSFSGTSRRNKVLLISMAMINFCASCGFSLLAPFFPAEAAKKGASSFITGLIFGDFEFVIFLTSPIFGNYLTRIGSRFMFISGVMVCGSCSILFGLLDRSPDGHIYIIMCFLCRSMEALGASAYVTALFAIIANSFPNHVTTVLGVLETFSGMGMVAGPAIGGALYEAGGFGLPFFVVGSFVIGIGVVCILAMPKIDDAHKPFSKSVLYLLRNPYVIFVSLVISSGSFAIGFIDPTLAQHVSPIPQLHNKTWAIGLMFIISTGTYTLTSPMWGYLSDTKHQVNSMMIMGNSVSVIAYLLLGPSPILQGIIPFNLYVLIIGLALMGLGIGCGLIPSFKALMNGAAALGMPENFDTYGVVSGSFNSMFSFGAFLGPMVGGLLVQEVGFDWGATAASGYMLFTIICLSSYVGFKRCCSPEAKVIVPEGTLAADNQSTTASDV